VFGWLRQIVNRPGVVIIRCGTIKNLHFNTIVSHILVWARCQRRGTHENPAVTPFADFEIHFKHKIRPLLGVDHHVVAAWVWVYAVFLHWSAAWFGITGHPTIQCLSVEKQ